MFKIDRIDILTYYILIIGLLIDHISTFIGTNYYGLSEANLIAKGLMNIGIWSYVDLIICLTFIKLLQIVIKRYKEIKIILILPLLTGIFRIAIGISNFLMFLI